jgi:hypothetical protein
MTDRAKFEQMLESLINGDQKQAEEIFHELVVAKSREIYENLLDDDVQVDEASDEDEEDEDMEENMDFETVGGDPADAMIDAVVAGDEEGDEMGGDEMDMGDEMGGGDEPATKDDVMDIKDALDELKAEFEAMLAGEQGEEEGGEEEFGGEEEGGEEDEEMKDGVQFEASDDEEDDDMDEGMVREYVEKVAPAKMGDNGVNNKSTVAGKNDMGGTTANIAKGGESKGAGTQGGLAKPAAKDLNSGNVNVPGSKTATKMSPAKAAGGDDGTNKKSTIGA